MAIRTIIEKQSGTTASMELPILVYEDTGAAIDAGQAVTAAVAAAPTDIEGLLPSGDPSIEELCESIWRIAITYGNPTLQYLLQQRRANLSVHAETLELTWAAPVARYPGTAVDLKGSIGEEGGLSGATIPPGNQTHSTSLEMTVGSFTPAYRKLVTAAARAGVVNSDAVKGFPAGTLQLVSFAATQTSQVKYQCTYGYSYKPNVTGETRGDVVAIAYNGHDYVMNSKEPILDRNDNVLAYVIKGVYVTRPRGTLDFSTLSPAGFDVLPDSIA